jgi:hypothetical protein
VVTVAADAVQQHQRLAAAAVGVDPAQVAHRQTPAAQAGQAAFEGEGGARQRTRKQQRQEHREQQRQRHRDAK